MLLGSIPTADELARLLGGEDWRVGKHLRSGRKDASFWIHYLWRVSGHPSFDPPFVLASVQADEWVEQPGSGPTWRKAVFACGEAAEVVSLRMDPIARALNRVPLLAPLGELSFDGISYSVAFASGKVEGELSFSNPQHPLLRALERSLFRLGQRVARDSGNAGLHECVRIWRRYCAENAEPNVAADRPRD